MAGVLFRALLTAIAVVVLIPVGVILVGGYFPDLPTVGLFAS